MKKFVSAMLSATMLAALLVSTPVSAAEFATREYAINEFVNVAKEGWAQSGSANGYFADYNSISEEYRDSIDRAYVNGIIIGYEDNTLRPKDSIKRIEALAILSRCLGDSILSDNEPGKFSDVPDWAKTVIDRLSSAGIVKGYGDGRLGSEDYLTVEQVALLTERVKSSEQIVPQYPTENAEPITFQGSFGYSLEVNQSVFVIEDTELMDTYTYMTSEKLEAPVCMSVREETEMDAQALIDGLALQSGKDDVLVDKTQIGADGIDTTVVYYEKENEGINQIFAYYIIPLENKSLLIEINSYEGAPLKIDSEFENMLGTLSLNQK